MRLQTGIAMALAATALSVAGSSMSKPILAHYMPWYVARPYSSGWGWHWTMNHFNPDVTNSSGERQIASWYYPMIGPYDTADPVVLEYHMLLMKLSGIDGVIVDWYGPDNWADYAQINRHTLALRDWAMRAGLKFALMYEDRTIGIQINGGFFPASSAIAHARETMLYVQTNYFNHPACLRRGGVPVFLNFGPEYFTSSSQWVDIFSVLSLSNRPAFFTQDNRLSSGAGAFNWPPMWMTQSNGVLTPGQLEKYLVEFEAKALASPPWPAFVSSAFPRFHDIYATAGVRPSYGLLEDLGGQTFRRTLSRAMTNASAMIQLVTWNDFGEGTVVEPTTQFGYRDLGIVQDLRRRFWDRDFPHTTNDLALATRVFELRRKHSSEPVLLSELDRVFSNVIQGRLNLARAQVHGLESRSMVIYDLAMENGELRFSVGGFIAGPVVELRSTPSLSMPWQRLQTQPLTTNLITLTVPVSDAAGPLFLNVGSSL